MKKLALATLMALAFSVFTPALPQVHAAFLEDKLAEVVAQDVNAARIQDLLKVKKELEQGKKDALWGIITKTAVPQVSESSPPVTVGTVFSGDLSRNVEAVLRQEVQKKVGDRLKPFEKDLAVMALLFNFNGALEPQVAQESDTLTGAPENYRQALNMTATAYAPGPLDNGKWGNLTYMGGTVKKGVAAVDPNIIPMGTRLWVEGYGEAIAEDQGSAIKGNRIDLAFNNRTEALDYGIQKVKVYVLN